MTTALILRFLLILIAMLVAATAGYLLARHRCMQRNAYQIAVMSAEILKMRRRASAAEAEAASTHAHHRRKMRRG